MTLLPRLLLAASLATALINAEWFDVTTIYRLPESAEPTPATANVSVPDCYVGEQGVCDWIISSGFTETTDEADEDEIAFSALKYLALEEGFDSLVHQFPSPSTWTRGMLCLQMEAYIQPDIGASISVSAVQGNNTQLLATLRSTSEKAEKWKLASAVDLDSEFPWQLVISARRLVTIYNISTCRDQDMSLVVLNPATEAEINGRTNARGLPIASGDDASTIGTLQGVDLPECTCAADGCDWSISNWIMTDTNLIEPKLQIVSGRNTEFELAAGVTTKPVKFLGKLKLTSSVYSFNLYLSGENGVLFFFQFDIYNMYLYNIKFFKCHTPQNCQHQHNGYVSYLNGYGDRGERLRIDLSLSSSSIDFRVKSPGTNMQDYHHVYNTLDVDDVTSFSLRLDSSGHVTQILAEPVLALIEESGNLTSPWFQPHGAEICIALEVFLEGSVSDQEEVTTFESGEEDETQYSSERATDASDIQLAVETVDGRSKITPLQVSESEKGKWSRHRLMLALPGGSLGQKVRVIVAASNRRYKLLVQRIAGCSAEEDTRVLSGDAATSIQGVYDVPQAESTNELREDSSCLNGAKMDDTLGQCVCPAGFTGSACAQGCGWNRYGDDCGGVCSMTLRGCRSMIMCRPQLGCQCAPGYTGILCDSECAEWQYGASCKQRCGHCAGEPCDIHTGICHQGCTDGRYPPFCKELYKYLQKAPKVTTHSYNGAIVIADLSSTQGQGHPVSFQLQYKVEGESEWLSQTPQRIPDKETATYTEVGTLTSLRSGVRYQVRVVLIDITGKRYDGELVPVSAFSSECFVPDSHDYELRSSYQWKNGINVTWTYPTTHATWCPLLYHEVLLLAGRRQLESRTPAGVETAASFVYLQPGVEYQVQVTAVTNKGRAVSSPRISVRTTEEAPDHVTDLNVTLCQGRSLEVTWKPPRRPSGIMKRYQISYQCLHLLACPDVTCSDSHGQLEVVATSSTISRLQPHAVYKISVAGVSGSVGPSTAILAATASQLPDATPASSARPVSSRSNSSLTVNWEPPSAANCSEINGYILGYRYELTKPSQLVPLLEATTTDTTATFDNLEPLTQYVVKVYVVTEDGWNSARALDIPAMTRATTPSAVRDLVVYARERRRLSLRWREPSLLYGDLASFTVSVARGDVTLVAVTVRPQRCVAWPTHYCHTVKDLLIDTSYTVTVQARNTEVAEDGEEATIVAQTKEAAPEAPSFAQVVNLTTDSATIEWGIPDMINGKLRSFLISIEETDAANSSQCCQNFPMKEMAVLGEEGIRSSYQIKMSDLKPATSYALSVSAKTVGLGPPVSMTIHTRPEAPVLTEPPRVTLPTNEETALRVNLTPYQPDELVSRYLLFMEGASADKESRDQIADLWLADQINATTNKTLSLVAEYTKATLPSDNTLILAMQDRRVDGSTSTGSVNNNHRLLLALVLDYCGSVGVGFVWSESFTLVDPANDI